MPGGSDDLERLRSAAEAGDCKTVGEIIHSHHSFPPPLGIIEDALDQLLGGAPPELPLRKGILAWLVESVSPWLDDRSWWGLYKTLDDQSKDEWHYLAREWYNAFSKAMSTKSGSADMLWLAKSFEMWFKLPSDSEAYGLWRSAYQPLKSHIPLGPVHRQAVLGILSEPPSPVDKSLSDCAKCKKKVHARFVVSPAGKDRRPKMGYFCPDCGSRVFGPTKGEIIELPPSFQEETVALTGEALPKTYTLTTESVRTTTRAKRATRSDGGDTAQKETAQERYVNLWFTRQDNDQARIPEENTLVKDKTVYLRVQIAPYDQLTILKDAQPFPKQEEIERAYRELKDKEIPLEVTLFSNDFEIPQSQQTKPLTLKLGEPTATLYFLVKPFGLGRAQLRLCVFYHNHMLQSLIIRASVAATEIASDEHQQASIEMTFSPDFSNADEMPRRTAWIGINDNTDGTHTIMVKGHGQKALNRRLESKIESALTQARDKLLQVSFRQGTFEYRFDRHNSPLETTSFEKDMIDLALKGSELFNAVIGDEARPSTEDFDEAQARSRVLRDLLCQDPTDGGELTVQIVRLRFDSMWPWAMMYDLPIDSSVSQVCTDFSANGKAVRRYGECLSTCAHRHPRSKKHDRRIVCPYGFWGFKAILEQPVTHGTSSVLPQSINIGTEEPLFEMPAIKEVDDDHLETMRKASFRVLDSKEKVEESFEEGEPHIVYFFCHCDRASDGIYVGVGHNQSPDKLKPNDFTNWTEDWQSTSRNPLVFINGCHSVALVPSDLSSFMQPFVNAKASGIIGTEITVHSFLATEFAQGFFKRFIAKDHPDQRQNVGQIIRDLRLELLMKRNPLGLVYTAYCSADLRLV